MNMICCSLDLRLTRKERYERRDIKFLRKRDYKLIRELGQGACGKTVLLYDDQINEHFVCKKYAPYSEEHRSELFTNFIREIKLLHQIHHPHVVRVFNYYLYPESLSGYILMEYVNGSDIDEFLGVAPEKSNELFIQAISGFRYLESNNILHRDIRSQNLMVRDDGTLKIIDLGFGKRIHDSGDFDKSISLNWWCELPDEFRDDTYDFKTEVYFLGKLFEKTIQEKEIDHFEYGSVLTRMCQTNPEERIETFFEIEKEIQSNQFYEIGFSYKDKSSYRNMADSLQHSITKIEKGAKYFDNVEKLQHQLEDVYRTFMLEENVPDAALVTRCFIKGTYHYRKLGFQVSVVRDFLHLLKSSSQEQKRIIMANVHTRLDVIVRFTPTNLEDDDVPF
jgi:eukaryotic-like serine/threonine-protein kinase